MSRFFASTRTWDAAVALAVFTAGAIEMLLAPEVPGHRWAGVLVLGAMAAILLARRAHPLPAVVGLAALAIVQAAWITDVSDVIGLYFPLLIIAYSAAAYAQLRDAVMALAILTASAVAIEALDHQTSNAVFPIAVVTLCWLGGRNIRARTRLAAELHEAAARAAEEREARAAEAVADERRRIAREMHDVVAHSISIMVVQAGGARSILPLDAARAEAAAARIRRTGIDALAEMHTLLGVLDGAADRAEPSLEALPELIERAHHAGLPVTLAVVGERRPLPPGAELAAYRVVQEALTNAIKHAGGAPTGVQLVWGETALELRITDRGAGALEPELEGGGHGLVGMRERVRPYGGEVSAGRHAGGGYEVVARIPIETEVLA